MIEREAVSGHMDARLTALLRLYQGAFFGGHCRGWLQRTVPRGETA